MRAPSGLTAPEVAERVAAGRTNAFRQDASRSGWSIVRANVFTLFNAIVGVCYVVLLALGRYQDALFGFSAVANAVIGSVQEFRAKRALDQLALLHAPRARVMRDGAMVEIPIADVVADDTLALLAGDQVPADAEVTGATGLQLDESMLTGESDPQDKEEGAEVLSGSVVVAGSGYAVVTRVGAESFVNRLASEAKRFSLVQSELRSSINRMLRWLSWALGPLFVLVVNSQFIALGGYAKVFASDEWRNAVVNTIGAMIVTIPLGLVLMTSIAFAIAAVKLAGHKVMVQELAAVEGLARVSVVCLDKTGTLTEGIIELADEYPIGLASPQRWRAVLAWFGADPAANATAHSLRARYHDVPEQDPVAAIAFSSQRKWSAVEFRHGAGDVDGSWVLGAPEFVFPDDRLAERVRDHTDRGYRTLVLAYTAARLIEEERPIELEPVALLTFSERLRVDAAETLAYFAEQGVQVRIISGDNPNTVAAIARQVGIEVDEPQDARTLPEDPEALARIASEHLVFGRVTPDQKRALVRALKASGHTVAMTGDGVNDALAIKEADMGIAMESGSAATKAVARLVLLDGKFSHLPAVVAEGRKVIANIERVSMLFFNNVVHAGVLALLMGIFLVQFPVYPRQLSVIDGLTIGVPSFFLALMPNARRYVPGFMRRSLSFALPVGVVVGVTLFTYTVVARAAGIYEDEVRTGAMLILTIAGLWVLVVIARPIDGWKILIIGVMMAATILVNTLGPIRYFLRLEDPSLRTAVYILVFSVGCIALIEIIRLIHRRYVRRILQSALSTTAR